MSEPGATPGQRIGAFGEAVREELLQPIGRYIKGFRAGLLLGLVAGLLLAPWPGSAVRGRLGRAAALARRRRPA